MEIVTKLFGEINVDEDKVITFESGIIGFPDLTRFTLIFDEEKKNKTIHWMQSLDEPAFAIPVINPLLVSSTYDPMINDELLKSLGDLSPENVGIFVTVTVPENIEHLAVNLKAPMIINVAKRLGCQLIVEDDYPVKFEIYDILQALKEEGDK